MFPDAVTSSVREVAGGFAVLASLRLSVATPSNARLRELDAL
jgi:hypothetical protein